MQDLLKLFYGYLSKKNVLFNIIILYIKSYKNNTILTPNTKKFYNYY